MKENFQQIDALFKQWDTTHSPGCALAVVKNGEIIHKNGFGMATLEHSVTNEPDTAFYIASTSKQFAALQIALLEEEGLLSVEDDVRKYIPELPDYGRPIQIQHLIHHTSGLRDFLELNGISGRHSDELITPEDALRLIRKQKQLNFQPGERYLYSNSGYFLLSQIVERVTGKTMRKYGEDHVFTPLGMVHTHFHDDRTEPVRNRAIGYHPDNEKGFRINVPGLETVGSGGIYSTVEDLALWDRNFYNNILGKASPQLMERILECGVLNDGEVLDYAFGITVQDYKGTKKVGHSGGYGGYSAEFVRFPEHNLTIICLSNNSTLPAPTMALKVADLLLKDFLKEDAASKPEEISPVELDKDVLRQNSGYYYNPEGEMVLKFEVKEETLGLDFRETFFPLSPVSATHFFLLNAPIRAEITFDVQNGRQVALVDFKRGKEPEVLQHIPLRSLSTQEAESLTGQYFSDELEITASIFLKDSKLILQLGRHSGEMIAGEAGLFVIEGDAISRTLLSANTDGSVSWFDLNSGRVRNLRFVKK